MIDPGNEVVRIVDRIVTKASVLPDTPYPLPTLGNQVSLLWNQVSVVYVL